MIIDINGLGRIRDLSDVELRALESGKPEKIFPVFMKVNNKKYTEHFTMVISNIEKIVGSEVMVCEISSRENYYAEHLACQMLHGDTDVLLGLSGDDEALLFLAGKFCNETFDKINEESYDALCEFTNCINGRFATLMEKDDVELDIETPMCCDCCSITSNAKFYIMKLNVSGKLLDIISVIDVIPYMS
jgi:CheY-specific phosphatase CheX